jgi:hypothetical protein
MNNRTALHRETAWTFGNGFSVLFGTVVIAIGIVNTFWGNPAGFGIFLLLLSLAYFPPVNKMLKEKTGFSISLLVKILLGLFIIWASLGVGELFDKIDLMLADLS